MKKIIFTLSVLLLSIVAYSQETKLPERVVSSVRDGNLRTKYVFYGDLQTNSFSQSAKISFVKELWVINSASDSILIKGEWKDLTLPLAQHPNASNFIAPEAATAIQQFLQFYLSQKPE